MDLVPGGPLLAAFLLASLMLAIAPGPGVFYIVTRSLAEGRGAGLASVAGVALGNLASALGASIGLAALFALSSLAFTVVKYAGAAYLVYLGLQALRARSPSEAASPTPRASLGKVCRDGFLVALLNPKTAIFFAAFLPQFVPAGPGVVGRSALLGALFVAIAALTDSAYALAAGALAPRLRARRDIRSLGRWLTACAFIGLGVFTALSGTRDTR